MLKPSVAPRMMALVSLLRALEQVRNDVCYHEANVKIVAVGGVVGAIIGNQMDKQADELAQNIPGATVERVGEGIHVTFASG